MKYKNIQTALPSAAARACAGMEPLTVDDDICILKHETAYGVAGESPVSVCAGDESVASHFALVTAYEDIKKRLRDTERENTLLRKRVKQLEDKLFRPDAPPTEGPQYVNKAFSAYRGIYIEKEDLQLELNKVKKERSESERQLNEQLQAREMELLQLRTEMETSQVMKSLTSPQDYWQVEGANSELQIHKLQLELERVTLENGKLLERYGEPHGLNGPDSDQDSDVAYNIRERGMQQMYQVLCGEISRLHAELKHQSRLVRHLRPLLNDNREGASALPIQCLDDVEKNNNHHRRRQHPPPLLRVSVPHPPTTASSGSSTTPALGAPSGPPLLDGLREDCWYNGPWPGRPSAAPPTAAAAGTNTAGGAGPGCEAPPESGDPSSVLLPPPPLNQASLDDSSRSFPSPPKPSDALFWEGHSAASAAASSSSSSSIGSCTPRSPPNAEWAKPY
uniref:5-azacytidine induced 2 n=2 Tax=Gadus morhua TaxID=8049 RepID=A0A8C4YZV0_GADMO